MHVITAAPDVRVGTRTVHRHKAARSLKGREPLCNNNRLCGHSRIDPLLGVHAWTMTWSSIAAGQSTFCLAAYMLHVMVHACTPNKACHGTQDPLQCYLPVVLVREASTLLANHAERFHSKHGMRSTSLLHFFPACFQWASIKRRCLKGHLVVHSLLAEALGSLPLLALRPSASSLPLHLMLELLHTHMSTYIKTLSLPLKWVWFVVK